MAHLAIFGVLAAVYASEYHQYELGECHTSTLVRPTFETCARPPMTLCRELHYNDCEDVCRNNTECMGFTFENYKQQLTTYAYAYNRTAIFEHMTADLNTDNMQCRFYMTYNNKMRFINETNSTCQGNYHFNEVEEYPNTTAGACYCNPNIKLVASNDIFDGLYYKICTLKTNVEVNKSVCFDSLPPPPPPSTTPTPTPAIYVPPPPCQRDSDEETRIDQSFYISISVALGVAVLISVKVVTDIRSRHKHAKGYQVEAPPPAYNTRFNF